MLVYVLIRLMDGCAGIEDVLGVYGSRAAAHNVALSLDIHEDCLDIRAFAVNELP